jgi:VWFA-related protein
MSRKRRVNFASNAVFVLPMLWLSLTPVLSQTSPRLEIPASQAQAPAARIDLTSVGYRDFSAMARRSSAANLSISFLDSDHVLFTFNPKKLFHRLPECPPSHEDRLVHAAVFDVSTGKVQKETDWYLHDDRRYLWPLGAGKVLLRRLNSLYVVDAELHEKLLFTSPKDVLWTAVTPDGKQVILETAYDAPVSGTRAKAAPKTRVRIEFLDTNSLAVQRVVKSEKAVNMEATSSGFASVISGVSGRVWLIRFGPTEQERTNIARVRSRRAPDVLYLSGNTMLIGRNSTSTQGYSVSAFTVTGNRLWRQHWDSHQYWAAIASSEDGSRFAISTLKVVDTPPSNPETDNSDSRPEALEQRIQVLDTASGTPVLSVMASPVILDGQNFSLSPDGGRFVVLHGTALESYDLSPMSADEQGKYAAVKADVPGLYVPPPETAKAEENSEVVFTASDAASDAAAGEQDPSADSLGATKGGTETPEKPSNSRTDVASATPATGAPAPTTPNQSSTATLPIFKSYARVVGLDVVVADSKGHTLKGMSQPDFAVKEDGKPQTVNFFEEITSNKVPTQPAAGTETPASEKKELAPNIFTNESPSPHTNSVTLILYDLLNTPVTEQQRAKLELLKFLKNKPKDSTFALCVLSEKLQMIQGFTPDETLLARAARGQKGSLRYGALLTPDAQSQQIVDWLTQSSMRLQGGGGQFAGAASSLLDTAGKMQQDEIQRRTTDLETRAWITMDAFTQLARYLSGIPGRKSLIWLSGSFPLGIFPGIDFRNPDLENDRYTNQVKQAVNLLAESHIALYPVDVRGLSVYSMQASAFSNGTDSAQPGAPTQAPFVQGPASRTFSDLNNLNSSGNIGASLPGGNSPSMDEMTEHGIMDQIAGDTGGKAFYNTNGIEQAMAVAMEQEANYYALSYSPSNKKYDGKFRKIKVSLTSSDKKARVIHRSGYFAVDPNAAAVSSDAASGFGLAAMQHGSPLSHQILFAARVIPIGKPRKIDAPVAPPSAAVKKKKKAAQTVTNEPIEAQHYAIDFAVPPAQVRFDASTDGIRHGTMNFMVTSFNEDGALRTSKLARANSDLNPEDYQQAAAGGLRLHQELDVPVAATFLRMGVQDALSGRMGTIEVPLPVKAPPGAEHGSLRSMPEIEPD